MENAPFIGIHGFHNHLPPGLGHFCRNAVSQANERLFPLFPIVLGIQGYPGIFLPVAVDHKAGQILQRIQRLAPAADELSLIHI